MIVIGEKINGSRKRVRKALIERELAFLQKLCREQDAAGADYIDVNVGTGDENIAGEVSLMIWLVRGLEDVTNKPLCIDSSHPEVIQAGVEACTHAVPMINSVNGSVSKMDAIFPTAAKYGTLIIALPINEQGIPKLPRDRVQMCKHICERASEFGIPAERFFFDPLVVPLSTGEKQGEITLDTIAALKTMLDGVKTVVGLSNISFGLPHRSLINRAFLAMATGVGLDAVILNANDKKLISQLKAAELVAGRDRRCRRYIRAHNDGLLID
ncbi:MAG: dihydropteroate synthase [Candidatus Hydrogenedentota bacterium]|nr:MAG: dihydropteroate synthase [Candidatus Hydrogenedentota bacterium]